MKPVLLAVLVPAALMITGCAAGGQHRAAPAGSSSTGPSSAPTTSGGSGPIPVTNVSCKRSGAVRVASAGALSTALAQAKPGSVISLAPGTYTGDFVATASGRPGAPITLCGGRNSILEGESIRHGYVFYLKDVSWWRVEGFSVLGGQKGVVADHATNDLIYGLYVHGTGDEAIHLREFSTDDTVSHCVIRHTGLLVQFFGEGIYVGSANKNWCRYTSCKPDRSDHDTIVDNNIADTTAENIDIKEGTTGGLIIGNQLDGIGMVASAATAWINVKGNDWTIKDNSGIDSIGDGFAVHQVYPGWGIGNVFIGNHAKLDGRGVGIYVQSKSLKTVVACSNTATQSNGGLSNQPCTTP
jgi:hypothetical protein